jgi:predicted porin
VVLAYHSTNDALGANQVHSVLVGGTYDFGKIKAWLLLARNRNDGALDTRDMLIGASLPLGTGSLAATYVRKQDRFKADADATQIAMGYYYPLSKRTNAYLVGSNLDNDSAAAYQAAKAGGTRRLLSCGMRHQF